MMFSAPEDKLYFGPPPTPTALFGRHEHISHKNIIPPITETLRIASILHVVACEVELALCHRALRVGFQEH